MLFYFAGLERTSFMKKTKRILLILFVFVLIVSISSVYLAFSDGTQEETEILSFEEYMIERMGYEFFVNHTRAMYTIDSLYNSFPRNRLGQAIYPNNFGGMYIDGDGNLVVLIVGSPYESIVATAEADEMFSQFSEEVIIKDATFSFNELLAINDYITYLFIYHRDNELIANIRSTDLDVINNRIALYLSIVSGCIMEGFKEDFIDSPVIVFRQYEDEHSFIFSQRPSLGYYLRTYHNITQRSNDTLSDELITSFQAWQREYALNGGRLNMLVELDDGRFVLLCYYYRNYPYVTRAELVETNEYEMTPLNHVTLTPGFEIWARCDRCNRNTLKTA